MPLQILVVDDHPDSATALVRLLRHDGHVVTMAESQADALIIAAKLPWIDLLISDIGLPDGNGCDLLRWLRDLKGGGPRIAVALTGHGEEEWEAECMRAGYARFLVKPLVYEHLAAVISKLTDGPSSQDLAAAQELQ